MISIVNRFRFVPSPSTGNADMVPSSRRTYLLRALILVACIVIGFFDTFQLLVYRLQIGAANYSVMAILMSIVLFVGLDHKRARALNIHDREVDYIIGGLAIIVAITIKGQLLPRFVEWESMLRLDFLAIIIFAFGLCGLLFGMRSTLNFGPGWVLLLGYNAPVYLMISVAVGGGYWGQAIASLIGTSLAVAVATNRDTIQSIYFGLLTTFFGVLFAFGLYIATGGSKYMVHLPAFLALIVVVILGSQGRLQKWAMHRRLPTVKDIKPALVSIIAATAALAYFPVPGFADAIAPVQQGPDTISRQGVQTPAGWEITGAVEFEWASRYFGPDSSLMRQNLTAKEYNPEWDLDGRHRTVIVDTLRATEGYQSRTFGNETMYSTLSGRHSDYVDIDLGYGIWGQAYTVLDETDFLSYTKLVFEWERETGVTEKIVVIAVDDHRPEAVFPQLAPSATKMFIQALTILLRGSAVTAIKNPELKDLSLVSEVAREIVAVEEESQ